MILRNLIGLDRAALAAYCQAYGRWVEAERKLAEAPMLLKMPSGCLACRDRGYRQTSF